MAPNPQPQAPDTLPADFFSRSQQQSPAVTARGQAPDTLPADFFSRSQSSAMPPQQSQPSQSLMGKVGEGATDLYHEIGNVAQGTFDLANHIVGYAPSETAKTELSRGYSALKSGNGSEALNHLRAATTDIVTNHPVAQAASQQWDSSAANLEKAKDAGKQGHIMDAAQHSVGVLPMMNVASDAIDKAKAEPTLQNYVHAGVTLATSLAAYYGMFKPAAAPVETEATSAATAPAESTTVAPKAATPTHVFDETSGKLTPIESAVNKAVRKSGLPEGQAASVAPTGENIQPALQQGIRDTMSKVAKDNGVAASTAPSIRDVVRETADNVYAKAKSQFSILDEATGGNVSRFDEQIRNVNRALQNVTDDAEEAKLLARKANLEASQEGAFEQAKAKGVDPKLVDDAKANYKKAQALYDVDSHVKMSTSGTRPNIGKLGAQTPEIVDPKKLSSRLNKVYDSGRLQDAVGEDNAQSFLTHADNAQIAGQQIKEFVPSSPTGQKAMQDILTPNTKGKLIGSGANTDFLKSYRDFDALTPEEQTAQFGKDVGQVRSYLKTQARNQLIKTWGKRIGIGLGVATIAKETGLTGALIHTLLE